MKLSPRSFNLYRKIAWLFVRYAQPAIKQQGQFTDEETQAASDEPSGKPEDFARELEKMGPTFTKFGQLLSTRGDLLPPSYTKALERLQDDVSPVPFGKIRECIESELKVRLSKAFAEFDSEPLAAASIGQVHKATLRDGTPVVVKVQRPQIRERIGEEVSALKEIANYADRKTELGRKYRFKTIIDQFEASIAEELDYQLEARNLASMGEQLSDFEDLVVPKPVEGLCSAKIVTMERIEGTKVTELSGVTKTEINGFRLADSIFKAYLHQILVDGHYHSDPHPGNILVTSDHKVAFIDLGMVGRLSESMKDQLFELLSAISSQNAEKVCETALSISEVPPHTIDTTQFTSDLANLLSRTSGEAVSTLNFGTVVMEVMQVCADQGVLLPRDFSLLGKTLLNLDKIAKALDPKFDPSEATRRHLKKIAHKRSLKALQRADLMSIATEAKQLVEKTPHRLNNLLSILSENRLRLDVDAVDEQALISGFQKIANRIALGAIIGSGVVGSSLMMDTESEHSLFGYPAFPMGLFLFSALLGALFAINVLRSDST